MTDEFDVTIADARLFCSRITGLPAVVLEFSPHSPCFVDDRVVNRLYCHLSNVHPAVGIRRAELRGVLSVSGLGEPFTDKELRSMIGRRLRVIVGTVQFEDVIRLRVTDFLRYSGKVRNPDYSDNEYVFMIRELISDGKKDW